MLYFYDLSAHDADLSTVASQGLSHPTDGGFRLQPTLDALPARDGPVLVVDGRALPDAARAEGKGTLRVSKVPAGALRNVSPYRPPREVDAGGGYVACSLPDAVALLVIHRRGVWDLPKGTRDRPESIDACAQREVQEEVGIDRLETLRSLGTTQHGYSDGSHYAVKTTHWYLMQTPERNFEPDRREGIDRVARARWAVVRRHLGYDTLRRHMDRMEGVVRKALDE